MTTNDHIDTARRLASDGEARIRWAERRMPALALCKEELRRDQPLRGLTIGGSLHLTTETAALARCLQAGGATVVLCGSNPLSTRDDVCDALIAHDDVAVFARYGEDRDAYYEHLRAVADRRPDIILDDGADLIAYVAQRHIGTAFVGIEQTTTGVQRLRSMQADGTLPFPVVALNDAPLKQEFDNSYGTGQNTIDGILRATNLLIAGKTVVLAGYGWAGRGVALRARGLGANVVVTEVNPVSALHAHYDGFRVLPMSEAASLGDLFVTATGCNGIIAAEHLERLKDGAILANSGHFDVEIDVAAIERLAAAKTELRPNLTEYMLPGGKVVYLLAQGRLVGQSAAEASPAEIMDLTFTLMAVTVAWAARQRAALADKRILLPPAEFTDQVAAMKLAASGIAHDRLTAAQQDYLSSWQSGT